MRIAKINIGNINIYKFAHITLHPANTMIQAISINND